MNTISETAAVAITEAGLRIHVDPADPRGAELIERRGDLNPDSRRLWHHTLGLAPWEMVIDVGVNYGEMLVGAPLPPAARVVGFEPNSALHTFLQRTLAEADLAVDLRGQALGGAPGTASFAVDTQWSGTSSLVADPASDDLGRWTHREVEITTLDAVVPDGMAWAAKIDVEGVEDEVLIGAVRSMASDRTWAVMMEVLHLPPVVVARIARAHLAYLMDRRTGCLVRLPGGHAELVKTMLGCGWLYPQDCVLLSRDVALGMGVA